VSNASLLFPETAIIGAGLDKMKNPEHQGLSADPERDEE
jgi:hypothetical protein